MAPRAGAVLRKESHAFLQDYSLNIDKKIILRHE